MTRKVTHPTDFAGLGYTMFETIEKNEMKQIGQFVKSFSVAMVELGKVLISGQTSPNLRELRVYVHDIRVCHHYSPEL